MVVINPTIIKQSRICERDTEDDNEDIQPWEYDNPERNKADGCMSRKLISGHQRLADQWNETDEDCDLPNSKVWRDIAADTTNRKSIPTSNRKGQVLPEGKTFVFGSSSHPCKSDSSDQGNCLYNEGGVWWRSVDTSDGALGGDWTNTQPWDPYSGCSWNEWVNEGGDWDPSGTQGRCLSNEIGLEAGICPEGYKWSGSEDPDSWWSKNGREHPIKKFAGSGKCDGDDCPRKSEWELTDGIFHENIRFGIVPTNSFATPPHSNIYWDLGLSGGVMKQPQTGHYSTQLDIQNEASGISTFLSQDLPSLDLNVPVDGAYEGNIQSNFPGIVIVTDDPTIEDENFGTPRMLDIRENCGNPNCSVMIGGNHSVRYADGGLQHVDPKSISIEGQKKGCFLQCLNNDTCCSKECTQEGQDENEDGFSLIDYIAGDDLHYSTTAGTGGDERVLCCNSRGINDELQRRQRVCYDKVSTYINMPSSDREIQVTIPSGHQSGDIITVSVIDENGGHQDIDIRPPSEYAEGQVYTYDPIDDICNPILSSQQPEDECSWRIPTAQDLVVDDNNHESIGIGHSDMSYHPFGNDGTGPIIGHHTIDKEACDSLHYTSDHLGMSMGTGTDRFNPYWNTDWRSYKHISSIWSPEAWAGLTGDPETTGNMPGHCLPSWDSPTHKVGDDADLEQIRACGTGVDYIERGTQDNLVREGQENLDCMFAEQERNKCAAESYTCGIEDLWLSVSGSEIDFNMGRCSDYSQGGCGEIYSNQYKHMISNDKNQKFGSWSLYDQSFHIDPDTFSSDDLERQDEMAHPTDKVVPKCFKTKENYFKTDPINGVPLDSILGTAENTARKYVYRDWNPLLIVLELAQDLAKNVEDPDDEELELMGNGWGINRDMLCDSCGATHGERRDFCQLHQDDQSDASYVLNAQIFDHRSTWRWGYQTQTRGTSEQNRMRDVCIESNLDETFGSQGGGGWSGNELSGLAASVNIGSCDAVLQEYENVYLNPPDGKLTLRECSEAGCIAYGSIGGGVVNGCSYSKVLLYPGIYDYYEPSMDNTIRLLPDLSNCPIRDENDNLLYVKQYRNVPSSVSYTDTSLDLRAIPLFLNENMVEELMMYYHKLLCCYGKLDWNLFSTLFCGYSPIFDRIIKRRDSDEERKALNEQKCNGVSDRECNGSAHNRSSSDELSTGGFNFDISELSIGARVDPTVSTSTDKSFDENTPSPWISVLNDKDQYKEITKIKDAIELGIYGPRWQEVTVPAGKGPNDTIIIPLPNDNYSVDLIRREKEVVIPDGFSEGDTFRVDVSPRFPGLKLFSEKQSKYIKLAFDYLEGNYNIPHKTYTSKEHIMGGSGVPENEFAYPNNLSSYHTPFNSIINDCSSNTGYIKPAWSPAHCSDSSIKTESECISNVWTQENACSDKTSSTEIECKRNGGTWSISDACSDGISEDNITCESLPHYWIEGECSHPCEGGTKCLTPEECMSMDITSLGDLDTNEYCNIFQQRGSGNILPGGGVPDSMDPNYWPQLPENMDRSQEIQTGEICSDVCENGSCRGEECICNKGWTGPKCNKSFIDKVKDENWFKNWDNIAKKQYCHEDYFKCDGIVYDEWEKEFNWNILTSGRKGAGSVGTKVTSDYPSFSEISEKCLSFINEDICPIPHRKSDGGGNKYCERLDINEQLSKGNGGTKRLAPPGIKMPENWETQYPHWSSDYTLSETIDTGNSDNKVILSNELGYGKYCINPIDPQYYRSNICLQFCGNQGGEGGDGSPYYSNNSSPDEPQDQCINLIDNYCEDVFMGLKRGKTEYEMIFPDIITECLSNDDCNRDNPICYGEIITTSDQIPGKCGPWGARSQEWEWKNSEGMPLNNEDKDNEPWMKHSFHNRNLPGKRSDDEISFFEVIGRNSDRGVERITGRNSNPHSFPMQKNETTVFKDGSYEVNYKSELFKQLFPEDSSKCSDYGESKGYCGKEYSIDISPKKDKLQEDEDLDGERVTGKSNIIKDICLAHFPGYNIVDNDPENNYWLYRSATDENETIDFEDGLIKDLTMDKEINNTEGTHFNKGDPNPNFDSKLGEDENFYRWIINKGPALEKINYDGTVSPICDSYGDCSSQFDDNDASVIADMYYRMKHHWENVVNSSEVDSFAAYGDSDILNALTYDRDFARYLIHKYNRSQYNNWPDDLEYSPTLGPHHLWGFNGINYDDFNYSDISTVINEYKNAPITDDYNDIVDSLREKQIHKVHQVGDDITSSWSIGQDEKRKKYNIINRGGFSAELPCYDPNGEEDPSEIFACTQWQSHNFENLLVSGEGSTYSQNQECNIIADGARPCDVFACTQFQTLNVRGDLTLSDEAEIIQTMECNISGNFTAPNTCTEDFDCSDSLYELAENPRSIPCTSETCTIEECCIPETRSTATASLSMNDNIIDNIIDNILNNKEITFTIFIIIFLIILAIIIKKYYF